MCSGGDVGANAAVEETKRLLSLDSKAFLAARSSVNSAWRGELQLNGVSWRGGEWVTGLFEVWLREQVAQRMGNEERWALFSGASTQIEDAKPVNSVETVEQGSVKPQGEDLEPLPAFFSLDQADFDFGWARDCHGNLDLSKLRRGEQQLATAWWRFSWETTCREVARRYPYNVRHDPLPQRPVAHW